MANAQGQLGAVGDNVTLQLGSVANQLDNTLMVQLGGLNGANPAWSGVTAIIEGSCDPQGKVFGQLQGQNMATGVAEALPAIQDNTAGTWKVDVTALTYVRIRLTGTTTGTVYVNLISSFFPSSPLPTTTLNMRRSNANVRSRILSHRASSRDQG